LHLIGEIKRRIAEKLWDPKSEHFTCGSDLFKYLANYEFELSKVLTDAVESANATLQDEFAWKGAKSSADEAVRELERVRFVAFGKDGEFLRAIDNALENAHHQRKPGSLGDGKNLKLDMGGYRNWRTWQMSDHLPLWVEIKMDFTDHYLESLAGAKPLADMHDAKEEDGGEE
jgi:hypothetical protein